MRKGVTVTEGVRRVKGNAQKVIIMIMKIRELKLFLLLLGFLGGNLFGTILNSLRSFFVWDGLIIIILITIGEIISYLSYKPYLKSKARYFFVPFYAPFLPSRSNSSVALATQELEASYPGVPLWSTARHFFYPLWLALRGKYFFQRKSFEKASKRLSLPPHLRRRYKVRGQEGVVKQVVTKRFLKGKAFKKSVPFGQKLNFVLPPSYPTPYTFGEGEEVRETFCQSEASNFSEVKATKKQPLFASKAWGKAEQREGSLFNFFKIGAMIGFFVDAFKVGS